MRRLVLGLSIALALVVGLSGPNAARPDLRGSWPWEGLLPFTLSPAATTGVLWIAIVCAVVGVVLGLRQRPGPVAWGGPIGLGLLSLLAAPFGSGDHLNYAAYGRILVEGGDPWSESPIAWGNGLDPITSAVEAPWTTEPSVYGPFVTLLQGGAAAVGGTDLRLVVMAWQVLIVLAWLGVRAGLRMVLDREHHGRIDVLWTLNPLVLTIGLLGAHVDTIATALVVAAVAALSRWPGPVGIVTAGVLTGLAAGSKFTYAVIGVAMVLTWVMPRPTGGGQADAGQADAGQTGPPRLDADTTGHGLPPSPPSRSRLTLPGCTTRIGWLLLGVLPTLALLHAWTGPHVYDQLARARSSVSLASPWRLVLGWLGEPLGGGTTRSLISVGAMVLAIVLAAIILRRVRAVDRNPATAVLVTTAALATAYSLSAPYTLPWYDLLAWSALPAVAPGVLDGVLLARLGIMAAAYVPGRVLGMTPEVETVTLGFRKEVAPWLQLVLWIAAMWLLVRPGAARVGSGRSSEPARPGS